MAYTTTYGPLESLGSTAARQGTLTISSYTAGGEPVPAIDLGLTRVVSMRLGAKSTGGYIITYVAATGKFLATRPDATGGLVTETLPDIKGGIFANITTDAAAAALNDALVMALTDATVTTAGGLASTTGKTTGLTSPNTINAGTVGRNVVIAQNQNGAGGTWTAGWARIVGTDQFGAAQTEDIALQTTAIADTKFRLSVGLLSFATVTSVKLLNSAKTAAQAGPASSRLSVGIGTIFGLRGAITAESDIKTVAKDGVAVAAATYIGTPSQLDMGANVADGVDILVSYDAAASNLVDLDAASAAVVGDVEFFAIGH